jgi:hypothetical protein
MNRRTAQTGAVLCLALLLVACGADGPRQKVVAGALTAAQANSEYITEEAALPPLPKGIAWPPPSVAAKDNAGNVLTYGPGVGRQYADFKWGCSWMKVVLADKPSSTAYTTDLKSLAAFKRTYVYTSQLSARQVFDPEFSSAELGDTSGFSSDYRANCTS